MLPPGWCAAAAVDYQSPCFHRPHFERAPPVQKVARPQGKPVLFAPCLRRRSYHFEVEAVATYGNAIGAVGLTGVSILQTCRREGEVVAEAQVLEAVAPALVRRRFQQKLVEADAAPLGRQVEKAEISGGDAPLEMPVRSVGLDKIVHAPHVAQSGAGD